MNKPHKEVKNRIKVPNDFEKINETNIFNFLDRIEPFGWTSMRDAIFLSLEKVKRVSQGHSSSQKFSGDQNSGYMNQTSRNIKYSFKVIVVTDGEDNCSEVSAPFISQYLSDLTHNTSVDDLNLLFLTVDLNRHDQANLDIIGISHNSSTHCKKLEAKSEELVEIFEREIFRYEQIDEVHRVVKVDGADILLKETRIKSVEILAEKNFAVTFVIDISGSMEGKRWNNLKAAIRNLKDKLSKNPKNMVDLILFNDSVFHYTHPHFNKKFSNELCSSFCSTKPLLCFFCCFACAPCLMSELALSKAQGRDFVCPGLLPVFFCAPIFLALNRRKLRKRYNIPGNCCLDCCIEPFCCFCMASQEWAEARFRGEGLALH